MSAKLIEMKGMTSWDESCWDES